MNAGMFGLANGRGIAGRTLVGRAGVGALPTVASLGTLTNAVGAAVSSVSLTAGVRARILNITGAGALRFGLINNGTGSGTSSSIELWIDGQPVVNQSLASPNWANGNAQVFAGTNVAGTLDFLPFAQSCEVFVTAGVTSGAYSFSYLADLYQ